MSQNPQDDFIVEDMNALRAAIEAFKGWGDYIGMNQRHYFMAKAIRAYLDARPAASQEAAAPSEEPVAWRDLYDANAPMADGEIRMTAAEDVLAWLLIEKIGVPDDTTITPKEAQDTIANVVDHLREYEERSLASPAAPIAPVKDDAQIKHMVDRFLMWRLPENFRPDAGISFKADFNENTAWPMKHKPVGTNLFDAVQTEEMIRHLVDGLPDAATAIGTLHPKVPGQAAAGDPLDWAVYKWHDEVANRPLRNVHRRSLDDTWRQVIRHFGGDPVELCGPSHDDLVAAAPPSIIPATKGGEDDLAKKLRSRWGFGPHCRDALPDEWQHALDEAADALDQMRREKNKLVLAAYPAMDAIDAIRKWCDEQPYANDTITVSRLRDKLPAALSAQETREPSNG